MFRCGIALCQIDIFLKSLLENVHKSYFYIDKKPIFETLKNLFGEMKQFYKSKNLLRLSFIAVLLLSVVSVFNSCKDDDEDDGYTDHIVKFEAKIVAGGTTAPTPPIHFFKSIVTQVGTKQETTFDTVGLSWTSDEFFVNSSQSQLNLDANAELPNADSQLIVTLYVDGEVAKSDTITGSGVQSASLDFSFLEL